MIEDDYPSHEDFNAVGWLITPHTGHFGTWTSQLSLSTKIGLVSIAVAAVGLPVLVLGFFGILALKSWTLPYRDLPGPRSPSFLYGLYRPLRSGTTGALQALWFRSYGPTLRFPTLLHSSQILTSDPVAVAHMLANPEVFDRTAASRMMMRDMTGDVLIGGDGEGHRRMRRMVMRSMGEPTMKRVVPVVGEWGGKLVTKLVEMAEEDRDRKPVDVLPIINKATADIIGKAGVDYDVNALEGEDNELLRAWQRMTKGTRTTGGLMSILQMDGAWWARLFQSTERMQSVKEAREVMIRIGRGILEKRKAAYAVEKDQELLRTELSGDDLLSSLFRTNMAPQVKVEQRMTDDELIAQIPLFFFAGNSVMAVTVSWALGTLAANPAIQDRLRKEIRAVPSKVPSLDELHSLPYLDAFVRELLRFYPANADFSRTTTSDTVLPLGAPVKGRSGKLINSLSLPKGTTVSLSVLCMHMDKTVYGPDAETFNPDRWLATDPGESAKTETKMPGLYSNLMTFGGGDRSCIGYKFAITELQVLIYVLVRCMRFEHVNARTEMQRSGGFGFSRPMVNGKVGMPLIITPVV